jgi:hypothetical protein
VRRFQNILFALIAFPWLSASAHCQLAAVPGMEFLGCSAENSDARSPARDCDECCAVEKAQYRAEHIRLTIPAPDILPIFSAPVLPSPTALPTEVSLGILTAAPPQLLQTWHFVTRMALPARAPSIAS